MSEEEDNEELDPSYLDYGTVDPRPDVAIYEQPPVPPKDLGLAAVHGTWTGKYFSLPSGEVSDSLVTVRFTLEDSGVLSGNGNDAFGDFSVSGTVTPSGPERKFNVVLKKDYDTEVPSPVKFEGVLDLASEEHPVITGNLWPWVEAADKPHEAQGTFRLDLVPTDVVRFRPSSSELREKPAHTRWKMVLNAVEMQVRRSRWTWEYFKKRRDERKAFVDAFVKYETSTDWEYYQWDWTDDDTESFESDLADIERLLSPQDAAFYRSIGSWTIRTENVHL